MRQGEQIATRTVAFADDKVALFLDELAHSYTYSGGKIATDSVVVGGTTYTKTYTWSGSELTSETGWEAQ